MKPSIIILTSAICLSALIFSGCNTPAQKTDNTQSGLKEVIEPDDANEAYLADMANFKKETDAQIVINNQSIGGFRAKIQNEKLVAKSEYEARIVKLEQRNSEIRNKIDNYKADGKANWELFKIEFNHDMNELRKALNDFTVDNSAQTAK